MNHLPTLLVCLLTFLSATAADAQVREIEMPRAPVKRLMIHPGAGCSVETFFFFTTTIVFPFEIYDLAYGPTFEADYVVMRARGNKNIVSFSPLRPDAKRSLLLMTSAGLYPLELVAGSFADTTYVAYLSPTDQ